MSVTIDFTYQPSFDIFSKLSEPEGNFKLALSDIASAAQRTEIFPLFKSRDIIKENYRKFSTEMETVMKQKFEEYLQYGGDPNVIMRAFPDNEWVIKTLDKQGIKQQNIPSEADIIENLKRKGLITS